jgi:hypothetical protein
MLSSTTLKFAGRAGKQSPEKFFEGPREIFEVKFGGGLFTQGDLTFTTTQTNESQVEASSVL